MIGGASADPNRPVATQTARIVENAIAESGVTSVNINSTNGGQHSRTRALEMRSALCTGLLLVSAVAGAANETGFTIGRDVRIECTHRISTYEAWNSAAPEMITSGEAVAQLYVVDSEAAPSEAGRQLLAIVMIGGTGTGIEPVAFRITAPSARTVRLVPVAEDGTESFDLTISPDKSVRLELQKNGRVSLDGHELGTVR
jgi:hypothetical protein